MNYVCLDDVVGTYQPNFVYAVDTVQRAKTGLNITGYDSYWGYTEFIYGKATATIPMGSVCDMLNVLTNGALELQMTAHATGGANNPRPLCVSMSSMTVGQFGWFAVSGIVPIAATTTIAAGVNFAFSQTTAGRIQAVTTTFNINNACSVLPSATTVAKTGCKGVSGDFNITVPNAEGWFIGCVLTGTGVGASALITNVSPDGRTVTVSVANSAAVTGTVTATYTGFIVAQISRPCGMPTV